MAKAREYIPKKTREAVYAKYKGHCAYCGNKIEYKDMQLDHIIPHRRITAENHDQIECFDNYAPACRACNYYKRARGIESMKRDIKKLYKQLERSFDYRLAKKYGLIQETPHEIEFYFERFNKGKK